MEDLKAKPEEYWKSRLTPEQFRVCRHGGTECAFTGEHWENKEEGVYQCLCCGAELFASDAKFDSGTGWPSFWKEAADGRVERRVDESHGMTRAEILCACCGAHLGHVFEDGPRPTGERHCVNSVSLKFVPKK